MMASIHQFLSLPEAINSFLTCKSTWRFGTQQYNTREPSRNLRRKVKIDGRCGYYGDVLQVIQKGLSPWHGPFARHFTHLQLNTVSWETTRNLEQEDTWSLMLSCTPFVRTMGITLREGTAMGNEFPNQSPLGCRPFFAQMQQTLLCLEVLAPRCDIAPLMGSLALLKSLQNLTLHRKACESRNQRTDTPWETITNMISFRPIEALAYLTILDLYDVLEFDQQAESITRMSSLRDVRISFQYIVPPQSACSILRTNNVMVTAVHNEAMCVPQDDAVMMRTMRVPCTDERDLQLWMGAPYLQNLTWAFPHVCGELFMNGDRSWLNNIKYLNVRGYKTPIELQILQLKSLEQLYCNFEFTNMEDVVMPNLHSLCLGNYVSSHPVVLSGQHFPALTHLSLIGSNGISPCSILEQLWAPHGPPKLRVLSLDLYFFDAPIHDRSLMYTEELRQQRRFEAFSESDKNSLTTCLPWPHPRGRIPSLRSLDNPVLERLLCAHTPQ